MEEKLDELLGQSTVSKRLRSINKNAWGEIENPNGFKYHMNIGLLAHQAADEVERLKKTIAESRCFNQKNHQNQQKG